MTTPYLSINGLEVTDKIGDHQMIDFTLEVHDPNTRTRQKQVIDYKQTFTKRSTKFPQKTHDPSGSVWNTRQLLSMDTELACSESHSSTTNEYRDEACFHRPMRKQDTRTESSDEATHSLRPEARRQSMSSHVQAAEPSQPPNIKRLQPSVSRTLPSASKVNISTRTLIT
ncbi:hypothetical protein FHG87_008925 [Trinorchestia longiramus]|nr:hypothetical protein FHG87_008925 [Trinorchestia longiramus]